MQRPRKASLRELQIVLQLFQRTPTQYVRWSEALAQSSEALSQLRLHRHAIGERAQPRQRFGELRELRRRERVIAEPARAGDSRALSELRRERDHQQLEVRALLDQRVILPRL